MGGRGAMSYVSRRDKRLSKTEYARVMSSINNAYHTKYEGNPRGVIQCGNYAYEFTIKGFNEYTIIRKRRLQ